MLAGWRELSTRISAILGCLLFFWLLYCHLPKEGKELEVGTCEITALDRDMSHPKRMIARQTARCACRRGQVAGTTKAKPACVDAQIIVNKQWCGMEPCAEGEQCTLLINRSGWSCTRQLGRIKTVTVS
ncbi:chemokine-like protein TAFA-5 isoform X2 [Pituophis catenifer annectens]|uniref:chemokine-like protein TAFA-5 isoform X2 n=1 Tax=Pituophis catenifer annectens TaxID=94852 RepID=UPI003994131D